MIWLLLVLPYLLGMDFAIYYCLKYRNPQVDVWWKDILTITFWPIVLFVLLMRQGLESIINK